MALTEVEAKAVCRQYGIPCPEFRVARNVSEAIQGAEQLGFPVAIKIVSPDVLHKSDAGCVEIGITDSKGVEASTNRVLSSAKKFKSDVRVDGILVEKMAPKGLELIIGSEHNATFGPTIMFGLGGIFAEVLDDTSFRLAPIDRIDAEEMLMEIKAHRILDGYRNMQPVKRESVIDIMLAVSSLVVDINQIDQIDLNPVIANSTGALAADARILLRAQTEKDS